ncbi:hypothetical protein GEMRC1_007724 [Eukaryota sp. GEM-RC1]
MSYRRSYGRGPPSKRRRAEEYDDPFTSIAKRLLKLGESKQDHLSDPLIHQDSAFIVNTLGTDLQLIPQVASELLEAIRGFP